MFNRIIVPVDGSKRAEAVLPYVRLLAGTFNLKVSLLQGTEFDESSLPVEYIGMMSEIKAAEVKEKDRQAAEEYLNGIEKTMESLEVEQVITPDKPEAAISSESSEDSLITMSTHGRTGIDRWVLGSVTEKVIRRSISPMLIVRPDIKDNQLERETWKQGESFSLHLLRPDIEEYNFDGQANLKTLVVPMDGSDFSESVLPTVIELSQKLDLELLLLRIASSTMQMSMAGEWPAGYPEILAAVEDQSRVYLEEIAKKVRNMGVSKVECQVLVGDAASHIVDAAQQHDDSIIVMASRGRTGLGRALLGSVADRVVSSSTVPVLLLRPA